MGILVLTIILSQVLRRLRPSMEIKRVGGQAGEFDLVFSDPDFLVMGEVKAKPLICYPLMIETRSRAELAPHEWVQVDASEIESIALNLASTNVRLPLSPPSTEGWPFKDMTALASDPKVVRAVVENWHTHLKGYRLWGDNEPASHRWLRFGCGNFPRSWHPQGYECRVSNTKILPGLDRTDDLKKGSSQVLGYAAKYKLGCAKYALKSILIGNVYAETHRKPLENNFSLKVARAELDPDGDRWEFVVDATLGFTRNAIYDEQMGFLDLSKLFT